MDRTSLKSTEWIDSVVRQYRSGRPLVLLFDYDGTLTPIVHHPSLARLTGETRRLLEELAALPSVRVGVISGRNLGELRELVGLRNLYYAGSGGLEVDLLGRVDRCPQIECIDKLLGGIQDHLVTLLNRFPGTWIEYKPGAIAIHYRGLLPLSAACFRLDATSILAKFEEFRFRVVSDAIEVTPSNGWDKGTAALSILEHATGELRSSPFPVYFGDAANDTEGMMISLHSGGIAIGIGPDAPQISSSVLVAPEELTLHLRVLIESLASICKPEIERQVDAPNENIAIINPDAQMTVSQPLDQGLLILDRDENMRSELTDGMAKLGWRVWETDTSEKAAKLMREHGHEIKVALVDMQLPGLEGARTLSDLGQNNPELIRCYVTEEINPFATSAFRRMSDVSLFTKPVQPVELNDALRGMLGTVSKSICPGIAATNEESIPH